MATLTRTCAQHLAARWPGESEHPGMGKFIVGSEARRRGMTGHELTSTSAAAGAVAASGKHGAVAGLAAAHCTAPSGSIDIDVEMTISRLSAGDRRAARSARRRRGDGRGLRSRPPRPARRSTSVGRLAHCRSPGWMNSSVTAFNPDEVSTLIERYRRPRLKQVRALLDRAPTSRKPPALAVPRHRFPRPTTQIPLLEGGQFAPSTWAGRSSGSAPHQPNSIRQRSTCSRASNNSDGASPA